MEDLEVAVLGLGYPTFNLNLGEKRFSELLDFLRGHDSLSVDGQDSLIEDSPQLNNSLEGINWNDIDLVVIASATFAEGDHVINILEKTPDIPILLWGFPEPDNRTNRVELNSTCGMNINASFLARFDRNYEYIYGKATNSDVIDEADELFNAYRLVKQAENTEICLVGNRVPGFYLSNVDELRFRNDFGIEISHLALSSLERGMEEQSENEVQKMLEDKRRGFDNVEASEPQMEKSVRAFLFLKKYASENGFDAFAIRCWPEIPDEFGFSLSSTVSWLNSEGIPIGCEGDVPGVTTMLLEQWTTGEPPGLMDLVDVNSSEGRIKAWHGGCTGVNLACDGCDVQCGPHPTIPDSGPAMNFNLKEGPITLARMDQFPDYNQLFAIEGVAVKDTQIRSGNSVVLEFPGQKVSEILDLIMSNGVGHHYALVYGKVRDELKEFAEIKDIKLLPEGS